MPRLSDHAFHFHSQAVDQDTFMVVRFQGEEGLSELYRFEILLVSEQADLDLDAILQSPATFTIKTTTSQDGKGDLPFHGILASFEQLHQADSWVFYRAELRPKLWWLTLTHHNQVFLNQKLDAFLGAVLKDGGLSPGLDFDFQLKETYPTWDYLCQYNESHFAFVSRWMERDGLYYWFEQNDQGEKMIASDTLIAHSTLPGHETFDYAPPTGLDASLADQVIKRFTLKQSPLPKNVLLKGYNYMKPSLNLSGKAHVQDKGRGEIYLYGEHFLDTHEGNHLAKVRAEEYRCQEKVFHGMSSIPALRPGYVFRMRRHFRDAFNQDYLTTQIRHEGNQARYLLSGLGLGDEEMTDELFYRNSFQCIPATTQFRPPRTTSKPRIAGSLTARVDGAGSGQYAELDPHGRYKVILPFDLSGRHDGKASCWLRMIQPYGGPNHGLHFPLHKDCEVMLHFIDGDPDQPIIAGAAPNPENPSQVSSESASMCKLTTAGGNKMHIEDQAGNQRIHLASPMAGSCVIIGAFPTGPSDPSGGGNSGQSSADHDRAESDHARAETDHSTATEDHSAAASDHTQAATDHSTASNDHSTAASDHTQAATDHSTAASDHTQAATDHSTASSDHAQAETDHAQTAADHEQVEANEQQIDQLEKQMAENKKNSDAGKVWGVHISTSKLLKVDAQVTNKAILGNDFTFVGGGMEKVVVGVAADAFLISKFAFTAAIKGEMAPQKFNMSLNENKLATQVNQLQTQVNTMRVDHTKLNGAVTELAGDITGVYAEQCKLAGQTNKLAGESAKLAGQVSTLAGETMRLAGLQSHLAGSVQELAGDVTKLGGEHSELVSARSEIVGVSTRILAKKSTVAAQSDTIATEMNTIAGLINNF
ncbi:type VI secretion system Vgr family protein [Thiorhodovibrio winogradskyi]|uniref:Type VI secretion system Vgr family protein n=1 Tax=Thiorhodovibrio winogradskyi TaxID=77007 RepID=A0ABZ0S821_9GAMM|nr:type VI secretion system tip protein TssI/VgrG [Thiorhodovibrio winogradskyi]